MNKYRNIYILPESEHTDTLLLGETLAKEHPIYNAIVYHVKKALTQEAEIDVLLELKHKLSYDENEQYINHDIKPNKSAVYYFTPKQNGKTYAGSLTDDGDDAPFKMKAYGQTMHDLYMDVLQRFTYMLYGIEPMPRQEQFVTPCSACDLAEWYHRDMDDEDEDD